MIIKKIVRIEEPPKDQRGFHGGLYKIWHEGHGDTPLYCHDIQFKLAKYIDELIRRGIDPKVIEELVKLTEEYCNEEVALEGESN